MKLRFRFHTALLALLFSSSFMACEQVIEIDIPDSPPKLVVNSLFNQDSLFLVHVSYSQSITQSGAPQNVTDARVYLLDNGQVTDTLVHVSDGIYYAPSGASPQAGHTYSLQASASGVKPVTTTSAIPSPVYGTQFSFTDSAMKEPGPFESWLSLVEFNLQDSPGVLDYYQVAIGTIDTFEVSPGDTVYSFYPYFLTEADPALIGTTDYNGGYIFSDAGFNGLQRKIQFYFSYQSSLGGMNNPPLYLKLSHLSEDYYKYVFSYVTYQNAFNNPFAEPARLHSNVTDGLGIFAGRSTTVVRFR